LKKNNYLLGLFKTTYFEKVFKKTANDKVDRSFLKEKWLAIEVHDGA